MHAALGWVLGGGLRGWEWRKAEGAREMGSEMVVLRWRERGGRFLLDWGWGRGKHEGCRSGILRTW